MLVVVRIQLEASPATVGQFSVLQAEPSTLGGVVGPGYQEIAAGHELRRVNLNVTMRWLDDVDFFAGKVEPHRWPFCASFCPGFMRNRGEVERPPFLRIK